jgi:LPS-assembly protein
LAIFAATIMNVNYKGKAKYILAGLRLLLFVTLTFFISYVCKAQNYPSLLADTFSIKRIKKDTVIVPKVDTLPYKVSKDNLDAPVKYQAEDSMVLDVPAKKILLYGKETKVNYVDNELISPRIEFDQRTSLVSAYLVKDSNGNV